MDGQMGRQVRDMTKSLHDDLVIISGSGIDSNSFYAGDAPEDVKAAARDVSERMWDIGDITASGQFMESAFGTSAPSWGSLVDDDARELLGTATDVMAKVYGIVVPEHEAIDTCAEKVDFMTPESEMLEGIVDTRPQLSSGGSGRAYDVASAFSDMLSDGDANARHDCLSVRVNDVATAVFDARDTIDYYADILPEFGRTVDDIPARTKAADALSRTFGGLMKGQGADLPENMRGEEVSFALDDSKRVALADRDEPTGADLAVDSPEMSDDIPF